MEKKRILCFGDSLTWGHDPDTRNRLPAEGRWTEVLQQLLGDEYQVVAEGQCGRTIATDDPAEGEKNGLRYIGPCLETHSPLGLVIIMLGTNDCKRKFSYSAMDIAGEMQILLEKVLAYNHFRCNDSFQILLMSPPVISEAIRTSWLGDSFGYEDAIPVSGALSDWYQQLAKMYSIHYFNAAEVATVSASDGCHLDAENQKKLGEAVADYIRKNHLL